MDKENFNPMENLENQTQVDPWEAAFAALDQRLQGNPETIASTGESNENGSGAGAGDTDGQQGLSDQADGGNGSVDQGDLGGFDSDSGGIGDEDFQPGEDLFSGVGVEDIEKYRSELEERVRNQAIDEIAKEFVKRGIRNNKGILGATMDDKDICKRDEDGVPHFYNPETGQEFRGDNPRRQAQEWVDDYNKELARVFNNACADYEKHLMDEAAPSLAVIEFAPKYKKLDDIRRGMFDDVISDYEVKDSDVNALFDEYNQKYEIVYGKDKDFTTKQIKEQAKIEIALRRFLKDNNGKALCTNFQDLGLQGILLSCECFTSHH